MGIDRKKQKAKSQKVREKREEQRQKHGGGSKNRIGFTFPRIKNGKSKVRFGIPDPELHPRLEGVAYEELIQHSQIPIGGKNRPIICWDKDNEVVWSDAVMEQLEEANKIRQNQNPPKDTVEPPEDGCIMCDARDGSASDEILDNIDDTLFDGLYPRVPYFVPLYPVDFENDDGEWEDFPKGEQYIYFAFFGKQLGEDFDDALDSLVRGKKPKDPTDLDAAILFEVTRTNTNGKTDYSVSVDMDTFDPEGRLNVREDYPHIAEDIENNFCEGGDADPYRAIAFLLMDEGDIYNALASYNPSTEGSRDKPDRGKDKKSGKGKSKPGNKKGKTPPKKNQEEEEGQPSEDESPEESEEEGQSDEESSEQEGLDMSQELEDESQDEGEQDPPSEDESSEESSGGGNPGGQFKKLLEERKKKGNKGSKKG